MDPSYNLSEIWQLPMSSSWSQFGRFGDSLNLDVSVSDPANAEEQQRRRDGGGSGDAAGVGVRRRRDAAVDDNEAVSIGNLTNDGDAKRMKTSESKAEVEPSGGKHVEKKAQAAKDYIHVRARRGQATDSHSLAERARREKISERMKILQDLVPGCNKVIGKALVLDEIINYIQSLQHQVEFLSMKLEAVNSRMNHGIEVFPPKDFGRQTFDTSGVAFGSQATTEYSRGTSPDWLHMQVGGGFERTS